MNDNLHPLFQQILKDSHMPEFLNPTRGPVTPAETKDKLRILVEALALGRKNQQDLANNLRAHQAAVVDIENQICQAVDDGELDLCGKLFYSGDHAIQVAEGWFYVPAGQKVLIFEVVR